VTVVTGILLSACIAGLIAVQTPATGNSAGSVSAADVAPFVGDWMLALQGPDGPGSFDLSIRVEKEKPAGDISSEAVPKQPITTFTMADKNLALGYSFTWEGNPVDALITLTPSSEGPLKAQIDFAGGAYIMTGTATKKDKAKQEPK
jgi:hypothetical protein